METRETYKEKVRIKIEDLQADINKLKAKAAGAQAESKEYINEQIEQLEDKVREGQKALKELSEATAGTWEGIREKIDPAIQSLESGIRDIASKIKK
jgi:archaellum component FlaC